MARTPLFSRLSRLVTAALSGPDAAAASRAGAVLGRRALLVAAATGPALAACAAEGEEPRDSTEPPSLGVAVIGAGLAGLHCAYWLEKAGVDVTVYEAGSRVGGRAFTVRGALPDGLVCELGGEFIDSNHATMHFLAEELGVALDDRYVEAEPPDEYYWVRDEEVPEATLLEQLAASRDAFVAALQGADESPERLEQLDRTPLAVWLETNLAEQPELREVLTTAYRNEFGLETEQQSALNLLYLIGLDDQTLRLFGDSDARFHAHEGSAAFAEALAGALGDRVETGRRLVTVERNGDASYTLTFETETRTGVQVQASRVVLALPFSVLRLVDLDASGISAEKREIIANLGYGTNTKLAGALNTRWWRLQYGRSGSVTADLPFQQVWDGSIGQAGTRGVLTNLLGGDAGLDGDLGTAEARIGAVLSDLNKVFPNVSPQYIENTALRMHWPSAPLARGSYGCYRFGEWTAYSGREGLPEGRLYFCGEHCSVDFQRFMEGAAETGALTAAQLLDDLDVRVPDRLEELVLVKTLAPQPCYPSADAPRLGPLARRRLVLGAHAAFVNRRRLLAS